MITCYSLLLYQLSKIVDCTCMIIQLQFGHGRIAQNAAFTPYITFYHNDLDLNIMENEDRGSLQATVLANSLLT